MPSCCCRGHLLTVVSEWMSGEVGMRMSLCVGVGDIYRESYCLISYNGKLQYLRFCLLKCMLMCVFYKMFVSAVSLILVRE